MYNVYGGSFFAITNTLRIPFGQKALTIAFIYYTKHLKAEYIPHFFTCSLITETFYTGKVWRISLSFVYVKRHAILRVMSATPQDSEDLN